MKFRNSRIGILALKSNIYNQKTAQSHQFNQRKWWLALLFSLLLPGLGQIYNGQTRKGFFYLCLTVSIPLFMIYTPGLSLLKPANILIPFALLFIAPLDAIYMALNTPKRGPFRFDNWFSMNVLLLILLFLVLLNFVFPRFISSYRVDEDGMLPSILKNDLLLIKKTSSLKVFNYSVFDKPLFQGDLVYFNHPLDGKRQEMKRCIGLPGQIIEARNGEILIDGKPEGLIKRDLTLVNQPGIASPIEAYQVVTEVGKSYSIIQLSDMVVPADNYGPVRIPGKGDKITFPLRNEDEWSAYVKLIQYENHTFSRKPGSNEVLIDGQVAINYVVEQDYYFVLGDNRDQNQDSRHWGFLSAENIIGRPSTIYFSRQKAGSYWSEIRWGRIGRVVD